MTALVVVIAVVVVLGVVLLLVARARRSPDGVTSFQRHIDALSPEARRSVVDRVNQRQPETDDSGAAPAPGVDDGGVDGS